MWWWQMINNMKKKLKLWLYDWDFRKIWFIPIRWSFVLFCFVVLCFFLVSLNWKRFTRHISEIVYIITLTLSSKDMFTPLANVEPIRIHLPLKPSRRIKSTPQGNISSRFTPCGANIINQSFVCEEMYSRRRSTRKRRRRHPIIPATFFFHRKV